MRKSNYRYNPRRAKITFMQKLDRQGWTNRVYWINFILVWTFVFICLVLTALSGIYNIDLSFTVTAVAVAFAELGVHTAYIIKKNERENCIKMQKDYDEEDSLL